MIKVFIISKNPVKVQASREAFSFFYENPSFTSLETKGYNHIGDYFNSQPIGDVETFEASRRRVNYARSLYSEFDFYVGIEGGIALAVQKKPRIIVYCSIGTHTLIETVKGCEIPLPYQWYNQLIITTQKELGDIVTEVSGISDIKQKQGAVGFLTNNVVKRVDIIKQSVIMALIPFLQPDLFCP